MDSLGLRGTSAHCRACDGFGAIINAYALADSVAAAERTAREWIVLQPASARAWIKLSDVLLVQGRYGEALAARHQSASFGAATAVDPIFRARLALRAGNWETAGRLLDEVIAGSSPRLQRDALWWQAINLREQGRFSEALASARRYRGMVEEERAGRDEGPPFSAVIEAQVLLELGQPRQAAALFDSIAIASVAPESRGWTARARAWAYTHEATALAAAGDTAALVPLARRVRRVASESGFGRDWRLHYYIRGLLLARQGRPAEAEQQFRQAVYSLPSGFSRINLELGRSLLQLQRPREAIAVLSPPLRSGSLEAGNLYTSRTELHIELGRAWEALQRPDSAAAHYRWTLDAWRDADPALHSRREAVRARLAGL